MESVEIAAGPYAGPDLGVLAAEGWRDGFEQIQLGKQELLQTLGLGSTLTGAYSPDLAMTTASLSYYGQASIDHVVVDGRSGREPRRAGRPAIPWPRGCAIPRTTGLPWSSPTAAFVLS